MHFFTTTWCCFTCSNERHPCIHVTTSFTKVQENECFPTRQRRFCLHATTNVIPPKKVVYIQKQQRPSSHRNFIYVSNPNQTSLAHLAHPTPPRPTSCIIKRSIVPVFNQNQTFLTSPTPPRPSNKMHHPPEHHFCLRTKRNVINPSYSSRSPTECNIHRNILLLHHPATSSSVSPKHQTIWFCSFSKC